MFLSDSFEFTGAKFVLNIVWNAGIKVLMFVLN